MEEAKAAAYYEELTRRGEGAAKFKQGLGFSSAKSDSENAPARGSALSYSSSSSFMSKFVKASSPSKTSELEKQAQIQSIQIKLKRKKPDPAEDEEEEKQPPRVPERDRHSRKRSRSRERHSRHRSRSREIHRDRDRRRRRRRSRSGSESNGDRRRRSPSPRNRRKERRSRSSSPPRERGLERNGGADYSKLIQGYDKMSAAERVKAKMKLQLAETADKDTTKGMDGWERFEFNKDAPLDDEEVEVAEDDGALVKHIGKSFRFSAVETQREERIKAAHDEAMFGASDNPPSIMIDGEAEAEDDNKACKESEPPSLLSEKVLAKKQGSWRDRIRHNKN